MSSANVKKKRQNKRKYEKTMMGFMGSLGEEQNRINYIQLNIPVQELDILGLVSEIPGSEKWPIRQLFQRDIDVERVTNEIMPYFKDPSLVKFFNPLTVAVLPIDMKGELQGDLIEKEVEPAENFESAFAIDEFYRVSYDNEEPPFAELAWSPSKVKLIAIDGQHRLSALKRLYARFQQNPGDKELVDVGFSSWSIPIVVVTVGHASEEKTTEGILEKTRNIFVTINKQAKQPTRSRTILLNDYSVTAVATQEILDHARNVDVPLAFFNWRDHKDEEYPQLSPFLVGVDELEDIVKGYLLGEDLEKSWEFNLTQDQKDALFWDDQEEIPDIDSPVALRDAVRERYRETVLPAFFAVLKNAKPVDGYVRYLAELEKSLHTDDAIHAWSRIVYGSDYAPGLIEKDVRDKKYNLLLSCSEEKAKLGNIFSRVVGLRAVFSAFSQFAELYWDAIHIVSWEEVASKFVEVYNRLFDAGVIEGESLTRNIVLDSSGSIINYKVDQVHKAYGSAIAFSCLYVSPERSSYDLSGLRSSISTTLRAAYRKDVRPSVKDEMIGRPNDEINEEVNKRAEEATKAHVEKLEKILKKNLIEK